MTDSTISWEMVEGRIIVVNQEWEKELQSGKSILPNRALESYTRVGHSGEARILLVPQADALNGIIKKMWGTSLWL